jgi:hypothetical protein
MKPVQQASWRAATGRARAGEKRSRRRQPRKDLADLAGVHSSSYDRLWQRGRCDGRAMHREQNMCAWWRAAECLCLSRKGGRRIHSVVPRQSHTCSSPSAAVCGNSGDVSRAPNVLRICRANVWFRAGNHYCHAREIMLLASRCRKELEPTAAAKRC